MGKWQLTQFMVQTIMIHNTSRRHRLGQYLYKRVYMKNNLEFRSSVRKKSIILSTFTNIYDLWYTHYEHRKSTKECDIEYLKTDTNAK